jgi:hypothetical protein
MAYRKHRQRLRHTDSRNRGTTCRHSENRIAPEINGEFRPGEMRHLTSDTTLAESAGYKPTVDLGEGISRYIDWIRKQSDIRDYFSEASDILKNKGIVHRVAR